MYHEVTYERMRARRRMGLAVAVALFVLVATAVVLATLAQRVGREQGAATLRESVLEAAIQCCAVEGSYPSSLSHLEGAYGLIVNDRDYAVRYEWLGDNIVPSVVVTLR